MSIRCRGGAERSSVVTVAKGLGIVLMVLGHSGIPTGREFIYMFHMPLFFILAGYCFNPNHLLDFKGFAFRRIKNLYIPFVKYGLIFLLLHNFFYNINIYNGLYGYYDKVSHLYSIIETVKYSILTLSFSRSEQLLGGYWFLPQLFYASIIGWCVLKAFSTKTWLGLFATLLISIVLNIHDIHIPGISIYWLSLYATAFFVTGYLLKGKEIKGLWFLPICFAIVIVGQFYWYTEILYCPPIKQIPYYISGISGTIMVIIVSRWIVALNNIISAICIFIGEHTFEILTWHFLSFKLVHLFAIKIEHLPTEMLAMFPTLENTNWAYWWIIYAIVGITVPCIIVLAKKYMVKFFLNLKLTVFKN